MDFSNRSTRLQPVSGVRGPLRLLSLLAAFALILVVMGQLPRPPGWQEARGPAEALEGGPAGPPGVPAPLGPAAEQLARQIRALPWETVEDDMVFRAEENDLWFGLWRLLEPAQPEDLRSLAVGAAGPLQLMEQTQLYRGRMVELRGRVRRSHYLPAPSNAQGIAGYWQLWLQTENPSGIPIVVYSLDAPDGFPEGMEVDEPVSLYGVVFKRWAYLSGAGSALAPVVLSREITWQSRPSPGPARRPATQVSLPVVLAASAAAALIAVGIIVWRMRRRPARAPLPDAPDWRAIDRQLASASSSQEPPAAGDEDANP